MKTKKNHVLHVFISILFVVFFFNGKAQSTGIFSDNVERYNATIFEEITINQNVKYGRSTTQRGIEEDLFMDVYYPKNDTLSNRPLIIFAHGGYFLFGDKSGFAEECQFLAESGYVVASINYRLIDIDETEDWNKAELIFKMMKLRSNKIS